MSWYQKPSFQTWQTTWGFLFLWKSIKLEHSDGYPSVLLIASKSSQPIKHKCQVVLGEARS